MLSKQDENSLILCPGDIVLSLWVAQYVFGNLIFKIIFHTLFILSLCWTYINIIREKLSHCIHLIVSSAIWLCFYMIKLQIIIIFSNLLMTWKSTKFNFSFNKTFFIQRYHFPIIGILPFWGGHIMNQFNCHWFVHSISVCPVYSNLKSFLQVKKWLIISCSQFDTLLLPF